MSSAYTTRAAVVAKLPDRFLVEALDDDNDDIEDAGLFDQILANVITEIDGYLEGRYTLPISPVPAILRSGALTLMLEELYRRRGITEEVNPHVKPAAALRARLAQIAKGEIPLFAATQQAAPAVTVIAEPARTHATGGGLQA